MFNKNVRDGGFLGTGGNRKQKYFLSLINFSCSIHSNCDVRA